MEKFLEQLSRRCSRLCGRTNVAGEVHVVVAGVYFAGHDSGGAQNFGGKLRRAANGIASAVGCDGGNVERRNCGKRWRGRILTAKIL